MKITQSQLVQIIKEEAAKFKKELKLKSELAEIEKQLNEVKAGDLYDAGVTAGKKYKTDFTNPENPVTGEKSKTTMVEIEDEMDSKEDLMAALKTIAKACGLSGVIELEDEAGDDEEELEVDTDVVEPGDEEGEEEEGEEEEGEEEEGEEEEVEEEEGEEEEGEEEEGEEEGFTLAKDEATEESLEESKEEEDKKEEAVEEMEVKEESKEEEDKKEEAVEEKKESLNENYEKKRMMELAGLKK